MSPPLLFFVQIKRLFLCCELIRLDAVCNMQSTKICFIVPFPENKESLPYQQAVTRGVTTQSTVVILFLCKPL